MVACAITPVLAVLLTAQATDTGWPMHGGVNNIRYSPLAQINNDERRAAPGGVDVRRGRCVSELGDAEPSRGR